MRGWIGGHAVEAYVVLAYALSWAWWVPMAIRGDVVRAGDGWPTHLPGLAGPAVAAVVVTAVTGGATGVQTLVARVVRVRVGRRWWALVAGTAALALLAVATAAVTGHPLPAAAAFLRYSGTAELGVVGVLAVIVLVNGLGEETGWRGFAVEHLLPRHGLRWTALVVAAVWGGWHLPVFWIDESFRAFGVLAVGWAVGLVAASVVLTWMYRETGRSVAVVAAWHAAFNLTAATEATEDVVPVVTSVLVIAAAVWILRREAAAPDRHGSPTR